MTHTNGPTLARPHTRTLMRFAAAAALAALGLAGCTSNGPTLYKQSDAEKAFTAVAGTDPVALSSAQLAKRASSPELTTSSNTTCQVVGMLAVAPVTAAEADSITDYVAGTPAPNSPVEDGGLDYVAVRVFASADDAATYRKSLIQAAGECAPGGAQTTQIDGWDTVSLTTADFTTEVLAVKENLLVMAADSDDPAMTPNALVDAASGVIK